MKKILIIQGGGRANGNTAQLVNSFAKGAKNAGHEVEILSLLKHEVRGCLGCIIFRPKKTEFLLNCYYNIIR